MKCNLRLDRSQSLFYFVPQEYPDISFLEYPEYHSLAGSANLFKTRFLVLSHLIDTHAFHSGPSLPRRASPSSATRVSTSPRPLG